MESFYLSYAALFATAGISGAAWYLHSLAFVSTRQTFRVIRLASAICTPGILAVGWCAMYYGETLKDNWHTAFAWSTLIGISGLPAWILSITVARTLVEAAKNVRIQWRRDDDDDS